MKKPIFTALSPNTERDDIWLAFKLLLMPWSWQKGRVRDDFNAAFKRWLEADHVFLFETGRTALLRILMALGLTQSDEVLLQAYTCVAVPEPVLWAGAKPVYVDVDKPTLTMSVSDLEKKITRHSKVLIIQHTFGQPAYLDELMVVAKKHGLFVIEDCAHALGSTYRGQKVGTFGDAAFFSFGRDKVISGVFGGALTLKDPLLAKKVENDFQTMPEISRRWIFQQLLHPLLLWKVKATYRMGLGKIFLKIVKRLGLLSKAVYREERDGDRPQFIGHKLPNALAALAFHQLQKLARLNQHRREIVQIYEHGLKGLSFDLPQESAGTHSIFLRYTLRVANPAVLMKAARKEEIHLGDWYTTGLAPEHVHYGKLHYNPLQCPVAEKMAEMSINLPTDIHISTKDAERIVTFLKQTL